MSYGRIGITYGQKLFTKYSINHAEHHPPRFIWVKKHIKVDKMSKNCSNCRKMAKIGVAPEAKEKHHLIALKIRLEAHTLVLSAAAVEVIAAETVALPASDIP